MKSQFKSQVPPFLKPQPSASQGSPPRIVAVPCQVSTDVPSRAPCVLGIRFPQFGISRAAETSHPQECHRAAKGQTREEEGSDWALRGSDALTEREPGRVGAQRGQ